MPHSLFDELDDTSGKSSGRPVPNLFPTITNVPYKIAIVGEAPGADEDSAGKPFCGPSGRQLDNFLSRFGILRDACFIGNVCQLRPPSNKIATFDWEGPEIQNGIKQLNEDLTKFKPNIVLLLGGSALHAFRNPNVIPKKRKDKDGLKFVYPDSISDWRGSFFSSHPQAPLSQVKCIASYHPAACMRQFEWTPLLMLDIQRCYQESTTKELHLPEEDFDVRKDFNSICQNLDRCYEQDKIVGTDIEGYWSNWKCISFSNGPHKAFIVPFTSMDGQSLWSEEEEMVLMDKTAKILSSTSITKVWQNGLYDRFVLQYGYQVVVRGRSDDIMLKHWELYCELEKSLAMQCSIYTKSPYYKQDIKSNDQETFWRYCCRDSAVTFEINQKLDRYLQPSARSHYEFNLTLLNALLYMELRGIKYNEKAAKERLKEVQVYKLQYRLDTSSGFGLTSIDKVVLRAIVRDSMCYKRDASKVKAGCEEAYQWTMHVLHGEGPLTEAELGRLGTELGMSLNVKGPDLKELLYTKLALPVQKDPKTGSATTDYEALLNLSKISKHESIRLAIDIGELRTRTQMLAISTDPDGRVRSSYNEVGSKTGRVTSSESPTGSGYNLQTIPDDNELKPEGHPLRYGMRDLLQADDGCYLAKCDLRGADGWTIGANLAALGDYTMLEDLRYGLKPAYFPCWTLRHGYAEIPGKTRILLAEMFKEIKKDAWDYFASKQCIWGFCYGMGEKKATQHVFNVSEGSVELTEQQARVFKESVFRRYNVSLWHRALEKKLKQAYPPSLVSPSGHIRKFFGRYTDILGKALADEPQQVTTYATNMAVFKCWTDPENRTLDDRSRTRLRVEPLHQVHDEFLSQFKEVDTSWATDKIKQWFNNEITIAGIKVTIPFEGSYGIDWAMGKESKKGSIG
jgi:uracil-DNA glycosylase family 4